LENFVANHKSAKKRAKQTVLRTERNRSARTRVKNSVRAFREALESGDKEQAKVKLQDAARTMRKAASSGILHKATASRRVSRMTRAYNNG
jgi:small subunit ribosomal protein S20